MLTLFSEPSLSPYYNIYKKAKKIKWKLQGKTFPEFAGHAAVDRSMCSGLKELGIKYNYNPKNKNDVANHVHVLANIDALKMAIKLKQQGKIKWLTAGVNLVTSSADFDGIIAAPEIDIYTVNSEWVKDFYIQENQALKNRVNIWYAGVENERWNIEKRINTTNKPRFLFYLKNPEYKLIQECKDILSEKAISYEIIEYGKYTLDELRARLTENDFVIYFASHESQGIALFEIWATGTPTFVWNPGVWYYKSKAFRSSSAPYLTNQTGYFFRDKLEFNKLIQDNLDLSKYAANKWIVENGTDKAAATRFLNAINYEI